MNPHPAASSRPGYQRPSFWWTAIGSIVLFDWFVIFLVDGITSDLQRVMTVLVGVACAVTSARHIQLWHPEP